MAAEHRRAIEREGCAMKRTKHPTDAVDGEARASGPGRVLAWLDEDQPPPEDEPLAHFGRDPWTAARGGRLEPAPHPVAEVPEPAHLAPEPATPVPGPVAGRRPGPEVRVPAPGEDFGYAESGGPAPKDGWAWVTPAPPRTPGTPAGGAHRAGRGRLLTMAVGLFAGAMALALMAATILFAVVAARPGR
jgi:hypothetical protein